MTAVLSTGELGKRFSASDFAVCGFNIAGIVSLPSTVWPLWGRNAVRNLTRSLDKEMIKDLLIHN